MNDNTVNKIYLLLLTLRSGTLHGGTELYIRVLCFHLAIHTHDVLVPVRGTLVYAAALLAAALLAAHHSACSALTAHRALTLSIILTITSCLSGHLYGV